MDLYKSSEITVHQLNELREENTKIQILDVREDTERDHAHIKGTIHMKLSEIAERYKELDKDFTEQEFKSMFPNTISVPQVVMDGKTLGNANETLKYLKEHRLI